ncbi:MAG: hypothetical protein WC829_06875 [Hyphomicrobium sp.]|jgi:hypothetical protein
MTPRKKKRRSPSKGVPRSVETVRILGLNRDRDIVEVVFSHDIVDRLFELYDMDYQHIFFTYGPDRWRQHRLQFVRCADLGMPAVMVRIEPPNFNPSGWRFRRRTTGSHQFVTRIKANRLRIRDGVPSQKLEYFWADLPGKGQLRGLILLFRDEDMLLPQHDTPLKRAERRFEPERLDLIVSKQR